MSLTCDVHVLRSSDSLEDPVPKQDDEKATMSGGVDPTRWDLLHVGKLNEACARNPEELATLQAQGSGCVGPAPPDLRDMADFGARLDALDGAPGPAGVTGRPTQQGCA